MEIAKTQTRLSDSSPSVRSLSVCTVWDDARGVIELILAADRARCGKTHDRDYSLALRELEAFARSRLAGFLALFHARVAPEQTLDFECRPQIVIDLQQSPRNRQTHRTSLPAAPAACSINGDVVRVRQLYRLQRL